MPVKKGNKIYISKSGTENREELEKTFPIGSIINFNEDKFDQRYFTGMDMEVLGYDQFILEVDIKIKYTEDGEPISKVSPYHVHRNIRKSRGNLLRNLLDE